MPEDDKNTSGYATSEWAGHPNFECAYCEFKTLDEEEMKFHVGFHVSAGDAEAPPEAQRPEGVDDFGNPLTKPEGAEEVVAPAPSPDEGKKVRGSATDDTH